METGAPPRHGIRLGNKRTVYCHGNNLEASRGHGTHIDLAVTCHTTLFTPQFPGGEAQAGAVRVREGAGRAGSPEEGGGRGSLRRLTAGGVTHIAHVVT